MTLTDQNRALEDAAHALAAFYNGGPDPWEWRPENVRNRYRNIARVVLDAARSESSARIAELEGEVERLKAVEAYVPPHHCGGLELVGFDDVDEEFGEREAFCACCFAPFKGPEQAKRKAKKKEPHHA